MSLPLPRSTPRSKPTHRDRPTPGKPALATTLLLLTALLTSPTFGQPGYREVRELPSGAVGERIEQVLAVVAIADAAERAVAVDRLVDQAFGEGLRRLPAEQHRQVFDQLHRTSGGLDFYGMRIYEDGANLPPGEVAIVRNRLTEDWQALVLEVEPSEPHRISSISFPPARPPRDLVDGTPIDRAAMLRELESYVDRLAAADLFAGTVLLARGDEVLMQGAWGQASRRFDVANDMDTRFNLGSMNKMFTAVAILQLVEEGKLSLNDPLSKFLGDQWLPAEITEEVRIEHLLTHTSGLGSYFNDAFWQASRARFREVDDYKPLVEGESLAHSPGEGWTYSNTGYLLLGAVVEAVTGKSYFDRIREKIYAPAGMTRSDSYDMDEPVDDLAIGYVPTADGWRNNLYLHVIRGGPAGGGFSTAPDLHRFARALTDGRLVTAETLRLLTTPKPELGSPGYGYGFSVAGTPEDPIVGHGGGFPGINGNLDVYTQSGWVAVVLSNVSNGATPVQRKIRDLITRVEPIP